MAVKSIVKVSELEGAKRLDAEYYRPELLRFKNLFSSYPTLRECVERIIHPLEIKRVYEDKGVQILLAQNIQRNFLDFSVTAFMPETAKIFISRNKLFANDVVITRSGANYGDAATYHGEPTVLYACADVLVIRPKKEISGAYLATFFNTTVGRSLIKRGGYGSGQPHVAPPFLKTLHVPRFSRAAEIEIEAVVKSSTQQLKRAESFYLQAEQMVLDELRWDKLDLSQPKSYAVPLSQAKNISRIDAEHFQPKYERLENHMLRAGKGTTLGNITTYVKRGVQPVYDEHGDVVVVNSKYVGKQFINLEDAERTNLEFWRANKRAQAQKYDVVINSTGWGTIGRSNCLLHDEKTVVDNHVTIIRAKEECNPVYLALFLNSIAGQMQTAKWLSGSSGQIEIYPSDISRFVVYLPSKEFQEKIADLVLRSYQAHKKAKALLEEAKRQVEELIKKRGS
jgi:type I restriction enzyme S subunit